MLRLNDGVEGAGVLVRPGKGGEIEGGVPVLEQGELQLSLSLADGNLLGKALRHLLPGKGEGDGGLLLAGDGVALPGRDALQRDGTPPQEQNDRPGQKDEGDQKKYKGKFSA